MNEHEAFEQAFKNGYEKGKQDAVRKMQAEIKKRCIEGGIYPVLVKSTIDQVAKELLEAQHDCL